MTKKAVHNVTVGSISDPIVRAGYRRVQVFTFGGVMVKLLFWVRVTVRGLGLDLLLG